jgi:hypothetical protein
MGKSKRPLSGAALQAHKRKRQRQQQDRPEAEEENQVEEETQAESSGIIQVEHPQDPIEAETQDIISEAKLRIQHYQKYDSNDRTDKQLSDILDNLPLEGREPFCKMILAAGNDEGLRAVIQDFKFKLLIPRESLSIRSIGRYNHKYCYSQSQRGQDSNSNFFPDDVFILFRESQAGGINNKSSGYSDYNKRNQKWSEKTERELLSP